jgi:FkbM family methyltransferase
LAGFARLLLHPDNPQLFCAGALMPLWHTLEFILNHPLNRNHKARALRRFLQWQIVSRLVPGEVLYHWVGNSLVILRSGERGFTQNIYCGLGEFKEMAYVLGVINPEDVFVDIGANVGSYTILACVVKGARGYCFEPVPSTFERLSNNLRINDAFDLVQAYSLGLADQEGEILFTSHFDATNHALAPGEAARDALRVRVMPLDAVLPEVSPTMIKIDVEGFETPVLDGMPRILADPRLHSVIVELNGNGQRYGFEDGEIIRKLSSLGFRMFSYEPFGRKLVPLLARDTSNPNVIFLRNEGHIQQRLQSEPRIKIGDWEI